MAHSMMPVLEQVSGVLIVVLFLADIFLTVLYARAGTGLLAPYWNRAIWASLRTVAKRFGSRRSVILSLAGPLIVVSLIGFWALGLTAGAALVIQPELGTAIRPSSGGPSTDLVTALLVAGNSLSVVGSGEYSPQTTGTRILFLINSLTGASVLSLVLSYLVQVYSGLRDRNALALTIDVMTDGTGDAAEMLVRLMPNGDRSNATSELGNLLSSFASIKEAHHFYPLLFYFRFEDPLYSVSRFSFVLLDLATLIETALDRQHYGSLVHSAPVASLRRLAFLLLGTLDRNFPTAMDCYDGVAGTARERHSYLAATQRLARAGIAVQLDGVDRYVAARGQWQPIACRVASSLGYTMDEIDRRPLEAERMDSAQDGMRNKARPIEHQGRHISFPR